MAGSVVVLAACNGGTVDRHALTNDSATIDSIACEGALLAHDVAQGKTTTFFAREQAEELRIQSSNLADALARRQHWRRSSRGCARSERRREARGDPAAAARPSVRSSRRLGVEAQLKRLGGCA